MFVVAFPARPDLGATTQNMADLYRAYVGTLIVEALYSVPQRWMCGVSADGA